MPFLELLAIAVALSMDALAVCVTTGITLGRPTLGQYIRMPLAFGAFQFFMPLLGYALGCSVRAYVEHWDHWIAFVLLAFIGCNMIREAVWGGDDEDGPKKDPTRGWTIVLLAIATSLDAMAVGFSIALFNASILVPSIVIGIVCACISFTGVVVGAWVGRIDFIRKVSGVGGGLVLLSIGVHILIEHGVFA